MHTEQSVCATETGIDQRKLQITKSLKIIKFLINFYIRISEKANDVIQGNVDVEDKKVQLYSECILKKFNVVSINNKIIFNYTINNIE